MFTFTSKSRFRKLWSFAAIIMAVFILMPNSMLADEAWDNLKRNMENIQDAVVNDLDSLDMRVKKLDSNDPRKGKVNELLDQAKSSVKSFKNLDVTEYINPDTIQPYDDWFESERFAKDDINAVKVYLLKPVHPGAEGIEKEGTVPAGSLTGDFIPQIIRLLMRFASLGILVAFVVSGVMFVIAFGNDERLSNAKRILYYSLIGFAFVTLAFAIVKAVTDIDFFGFI